MVILKKVYSSEQKIGDVKQAYYKYSCTMPSIAIQWSHISKFKYILMHTNVFLYISLGVFLLPVKNHANDLHMFSLQFNSHTIPIV